MLRGHRRIIYTSNFHYLGQNSLKLRVFLLRFNQSYFPVKDTLWNISGETSACSCAQTLRIYSNKCVFFFFFSELESPLKTTTPNPRSVTASEPGPERVSVETEKFNAALWDIPGPLKEPGAPEAVVELF
ncbi:hypothetical protein NL108_017750 [Boleophthalmus pectinirostris]|nr:hypothetical protein NL108_017750 [Boleophthalmus pectinirostris]